MLLRLPILIILSALLSGCVSLSPKLPPLTKEQHLLKEWSINGKLGIKARQNGGTLSIIWHQKGTNYTIDFQGPMAQGSSRIVKTDREATYYTSSGKTLKATDAAAILKKESGLTLPLAAMQYWVQAKPSPFLAKAKITKNEDNYTTKIEQDNWVITYSRYKEFAKVALPTSLTIDDRKQQMNAKMIIRDWDIKK